MTIERWNELRANVLGRTPSEAVADAEQEIPEGYEITWVSILRRHTGEWQATVTARSLGREETQ